MFVCMCYGITDKAIASAVTDEGVGNMRQLREVLNVGAQCGRCIQMAQQIIDNIIVDESLFKEVV